jgi:hypothetical protein
MKTAMTTMKHVIGDHDCPLANKRDLMEVVQDVESSEDIPGTPEGIRNPSIQVAVI